MKKKVCLIAFLAAMFAISSCDTKICYCYERDGNGQVHESEHYLSTDKACASLSRGNRGCIESSERGTFDPNDIAK